MEGEIASETKLTLQRLVFLFCFLTKKHVSMRGATDNN